MGNENTRWSVASDVLPMFPTLVWKVELEAQLREAIRAQALEALARMRRDLPPLAPGQGWQSVQSLHELDEFRDLVSCVHRVVPGILRFLRIGYDAYQITACWATVLASGAAHKMHHHPNNFLSGVYYVRTHPGADTINFHESLATLYLIEPTPLHTQLVLNVPAEHVNLVHAPLTKTVSAMLLVNGFLSARVRPRPSQFPSLKGAFHLEQKAKQELPRVSSSRQLFH